VSHRWSCLSWGKSPDPGARSTSSREIIGRSDRGTPSHQTPLVVARFARFFVCLPPFVQIVTWLGVEGQTGIRRHRITAYSPLCELYQLLRSPHIRRPERSETRAVWGVTSHERPMAIPPSRSFAELYSLGCRRDRQACKGIELLPTAPLCELYQLRRSPHIRRPERSETQGGPGVPGGVTPHERPTAIPPSRSIAELYSLASKPRRRRFERNEAPGLGVSRKYHLT
jgi:hypothetical protein